MKNQTSLVVLLLIYGLACVTPAFARGADSTIGIACLIMLPWVLVVPYWWANPLFFAGCVALARGNAKVAFGLGIAASMLAASFFACFGGLEIARVGSGFWIASMVGLAVVGHFARRAEFKPGKPVGLDEWRAPGRQAVHDASPTSADTSSSASSSSSPLSSRSPS